jgi:hypothetical protein
MIIKNRYDEDRHIIKLSDNEYLICGKCSYIRICKNNDELIFVDYEGGPLLEVGSPFYDYGIIDKIQGDNDSLEKNSYIITIK